jgi:drug/metabolite transporter (DMT)-like permease
MRPAATGNVLFLACLVALALLAFAGNSLLNRAALLDTGADPGAFAAIRLISGAAALFAFGMFRGLAVRPHSKDLPSVAALFVYAAAFSFAYVSLGAATGALILFATVQLTMTAYGVVRGARYTAVQIAGLLAALGGLAWLLAPGLAAPPIGAALLMISAGIAWGIYSLLGRSQGEPIASTARNFIGTLPLALLMAAPLFWSGTYGIDTRGLMLAIASGVVTSALGYVIWYAVLPTLPAIAAASLQLTVPVIAITGAQLWLNEPLTFRLIAASGVILAGIGLTIWGRREGL